MKDLKGYLERMEKAMVEKLFFLNIVNLNDFDYVIDFGCANGAMLSAIAPLYKKPQFLGVDNNEKSLELAKLKPELKDVWFYDNLLSAIENLDPNKKTAVILSSILHEIPKSVLNNLIKTINKFDAIIIRDMFFDDSYNYKIKNGENIVLKSPKLLDWQISDFKKNFGKLNKTKNLYHFLLKYTYIDNWETEVKENYFSVPWKKINNNFIKNNFIVLHEDNYTLKYKKDEVFKNFNFNLDYPTHKNIIYIKK